MYRASIYVTINCNQLQALLPKTIEFEFEIIHKITQNKSIRDTNIIRYEFEIICKISSGPWDHGKGYCTKCLYFWVFFGIR